jgi:hypothetical protein
MLDTKNRRKLRNMRHIRCFVFILMYLSFVLILEKLYLTTKWKLLYLFLMVFCWKKAQKSLISWLKFWHFLCHLKVRFIHLTFKNSVEFTQKIFFQSDNSYTKAHCFYSPFCEPAKVTKLIGLKRPPFLSPTNLIIFACTQNGEYLCDKKTGGCN